MVTPAARQMRRKIVNPQLDRNNWGWRGTATMHALTGEPSVLVIHQSKADPRNYCVRSDSGRDYVVETHGPDAIACTCAASAACRHKAAVEGLMDERRRKARAEELRAEMRDDPRLAAHILAVAPVMARCLEEPK